jgi:transposase, IS6 family
LLAIIFVLCPPNSLWRLQSPNYFFKRRRLPVEIILVCVRWYCKYGITYRDLAEMMQERGVEVDASTIFRWVQRYAPELEKRIRWYQGYRSSSWRVDEPYVKVGGQWKYLFRAVDKHGRLIDFMLLTAVTRVRHTASWARP